MTLPVFPHTPPSRRSGERGNILFIILIAIVLIGALTAAVLSTSRPEGAGIDKETLVLRATDVQRTAAELERAVRFIMQNGYSETALRFAHPDAPADYGDIAAQPERQIFSRQGGGAQYRQPPDGINDGSPWEFYAGTHLPGAGSDAADLIAVLPYVTKEFCEKINELNQQPATPADTGTGAPGGANPGDCLQIGPLGRFDDTQQYYATPNTVDETTFAQDPAISKARPALQACVQCSRDTDGDSSTADEYHFYHVLLAR